MEKSRYSSSDAKSYDTLDFRIQRLLRTEGYIRAISDRHGYRGKENIVEQIAHLHDHKGMICVTWKSGPSDYLKDVVGVAWYECSGEETVEHISPSVEENCDIEWCNEKFHATERSHLGETRVSHE